ncbi:MAG TPA: TonB-dependent receptor [Steroidobacter sp.]|uniref:TonB-dependent receptor n=1 Tax=Steroidobacter sp. TaxID=1978227 RepID=UPI002EDA0292
MSQLRHAIRYRLALALPLFFAGFAHAQDSAAPETDIEEIVVTGRAGVEEIRKVEVSYAVTTIGGESLRMDSPLGVADALGSVPGFWVESSGGEASANIRARGIPEEGFSAVGMEEDGLPVQHDPGLGWLNADQSFRMDDTIDRIEVVRGGPASMFSSNAPGGVVNFITRKPSDTAGGDIKVQSSDYGLRRVDGWYNLPVGEWRLGFGGFYREDDGIRDAGYTANKGGQLRFALGRSFEGGSVDFNVKRIDDQVIFYTGLPLTYDSDGDIVGVPGVDEHDGTLSGPDTRRVTLRNANGTFPLDVDHGTDVELTQYTLKFEYELPGEWQLRNGTRYRESDISRQGLFPNTPITAAARIAAARASLSSIPGATDVQLRYVNSPNEVFNVANQNGNGLTSDGSLRQVSVPLEELLNDLRVMRKFEIGGQQHDFALGLYLAQVDEEFDRYSANSIIDVRDNARLLNLVAVDAAGNPLATLTDNGIIRYGSEFANGEGESFTKALYFSDEWSINDQWRIDLGGRYEQVDVEGSVEKSAERNLGVLPNAADDRVLTGTGVYDRFDTDYDDFGWTAGVNWQFLDNMGVFARYTSTFRLPSVGDYITNAFAIPVSREMDFIEAGYKYQSDRWSLYATLFQTNYDSYRFGDRRYNQTTGNYDEFNVITDTETTGVELEGAVNATEWLDIGFSATWQNAEFGDFVQSQVVNGNLVTFDFTGNRLLRIPEVSFRVTPAIKLHDAVRLELDYQYFGDRYADVANLFELPSYDVVSANLRWTPMERMTVYVRGENLLNEVGLTEGNPRAGTFISGEANSPFFIARPIYGRNFTFSLQWDF